MFYVLSFANIVFCNSWHYFFKGSNNIKFYYWSYTNLFGHNVVRVQFSKCKYQTTVKA